MQNSTPTITGSFTTVLKKTKRQKKKGKEGKNTFAIGLVAALDETNAVLCEIPQRIENCIQRIHFLFSFTFSYVFRRMASLLCLRCKSESMLRKEKQKTPYLPTTRIRIFIWKLWVLLTNFAE